MKTVRELILIRHGKAEDRNADMEDRERKLTSEGAEELKRMFQSLSPLLKSQKSLKLWSSSLTRASQTAALLSDELGGLDISSYEFIASGDFESLSGEIVRCEDAKTLIIVGHEPYLGEWTEHISGMKSDFKKGSVVFIKLESLEPLKGKVQWAAHPGHYGEGLILPELVFPETKEKKDIVKGEGTLRKETKSLLSHGLKEMASAQREFMENPDDPESAHKFRVKIRQFRSVLSFLKPATKTKEYEYFQGMLRELAQKFGYLRELDVMMSGMEEKYPALMEVLKKEREEEKKKVYSDIGGGTSAPLYFELLAWIKGNPVKNSQIAKNSFSWYANRRLKKWLSGFEEELDSVDFTDAKELHMLRIKGKKLRYLLALLEPVLKEKYRGRLPEFKEIQDKLGRICDIQREIPLLNGLKARISGDEAINDVDALIQEKNTELETLAQR